MIPLIIISLIAIISLFFVIRSIRMLMIGTNYVFDHASAAFIFVFIAGFAIIQIIKIIQNSGIF